MKEFAPLFVGILIVFGLVCILYLIRKCYVKTRSAGATTALTTYTERATTTAKKRKKEATGLDALIYLIKLIFKAIWWIITLPYRVVKFFINREKPKEEKCVAYAPATATEPVYKRKYLLTKHEWDFYKHLKPIADKLGLAVLAKIRMADLVETVADTNSEYYRGFGKVKAKHVDFALARPENLYIELLIELDDSSHTEGNERDAFVESVYAAVGYKLLRIRNEIGLEDNIRTALGVKVVG